MPVQKSNCARVKMNEEMEDRLYPGEPGHPLTGARSAEFGPEALREVAAYLTSCKAPMRSQATICGERRRRRTVGQFSPPIVKLIIPSARRNHLSLPDSELGELRRFGFSRKMFAVYESAIRCIELLEKNPV